MTGLEISRETISTVDFEALVLVQGLHSVTLSINYYALWFHTC